MTGHAATTCASPDPAPPRLRADVGDHAREPWRPIQYLGCKLRTAEAIVEAVDSFNGGSTTVWDPFSGSSVVAQTLAAHGHRVLVGDTQQASVVFARALLGVGRAAQTFASPRTLSVLNVRRASAVNPEEDPIWGEWVRREDDYLFRNDSAGLLRMAEELPQRWKPGAPSSVRDDSRPCATTFAGTYFGIRQALRLDALRAAVEALRGQRRLTEWEEAGALTALCHAASAAVCSAGKHFAQPLVTGHKNGAFVRTRMLRDRAVDVDRCFEDAVGAIAQAARHAHEGHAVNFEDALSVSADQLRRRGVNVAYLDPPYTAQQYSRFYHVLDTLVDGRQSPLQRRGDSVTRGLYPEGRYFSPFCSKRQAATAFSTLLERCAQEHVSLVISYSVSTGVTGNARMISLDQLLRLVTDTYESSEVDVRKLAHAYRQFNSGEASLAGRRDPEYLIMVRAK